MVEIALFGASFLALVIGLTVFVNNPKSTTFRLYLFFSVSSAIWMSANAFVLSELVELSADQRLGFAYLITPASLVTSFAFYLFLDYFKRRTFSKNAILFALPSLLVMIFSFTSYNVYIDRSGAIVVGELFLPYLIALLVNVVIIFSSLYSKEKITSSERAQYQYLRLGAICTVVPVVALGAVLPVFSNSVLSDIAPLFSIIFLVCAGIAIVRHGLFDIKLAAVRSVAYLLSLVALGALYYVAAYFISITIFRGQVTADFSVSPLNIFLALLLAFAFQPVKQFFDRVTDRVFYRSRYDTGDFLIRLGRLLTSSTELQTILETVEREIRQTLKASGSLFVVYRDHHPNAFVGEGIDKRISAEDLAILDAIPAAANGSLFSTERLRTSKVEAGRKAYKMLTKRHIAFVLPLISAYETIGYLLLGEHMTGVYSKQDRAALNAIANELVIAVQNARSVQALRDLNANLEQRVSDATRELRKSNNQLRQADEAKDEFVSMASHQLRTPLTSVKGYISMVLEGDAGEITPMQKKLLKEAFTSSERMVHLIGDFLNVSRLQTGKFVLDRTFVNIADLVEEEVEGLRETAKTRGLKLQYRKPSLVPSLYIDDGKIHQVIMNFIDNGIYYSAENTTITVRLAVEDGDVIFEVHDTGIGVPKSEQVRLFTKFFRATNARKQRPDGTGIGLFLAKKVITSHGGSMVFESVEGQGSTFGFRLPIKKLSKAPSESVHS